MRKPVRKPLGPFLLALFVACGLLLAFPLVFKENHPAAAMAAESPA